MIDQINQTLVLIKPDAVSRGLVDNIIMEFNSSSLEIMQMKRVNPTEKEIVSHLNYHPNVFEKMAVNTIKKCEIQGIDISKTYIGGKTIEDISNMIERYYIQYLTSGPLYALAISGYNAIQNSKILCGSTFPIEASKTSIRGKYGIDSFEMCVREGRAARNLVHAAESITEANHQLKVWFPQSEITNQLL